MACLRHLPRKFHGLLAVRQSMEVRRHADLCEDRDLDCLRMRLSVQQWNAAFEYSGDSPHSLRIFHYNRRSVSHDFVDATFCANCHSAAMPGSDGRPPHATSSFVWKDWTADIGYPNG